ADERADGGGKAGEGGEGTLDRADKNPKAKPTTTPPPDLDQTLKEAGFKQGLYVDNLVGYVRFRTPERDERWRRAKISDRKAIEEEVRDGAALAKRSYSVSGLRVQVASRSRFRNPGLFVECSVGYRFFPGGKSGATLSRSLEDFYLNWAFHSQYWLLTKDNT